MYVTLHLHYITIRHVLLYSFAYILENGAIEYIMVYRADVQHTVLSCGDMCCITLCLSCHVMFRCCYILFHGMIKFTILCYISLHKFIRNGVGDSILYDMSLHCVIIYDITVYVVVFGSGPPLEARSAAGLAQ